MTNRGKSRSPAVSSPANLGSRRSGGFMDEEECVRWAVGLPVPWDPAAWFSNHFAHRPHRSTPGRNTGRGRIKQRPTSSQVLVRRAGKGGAGKGDKSNKQARFTASADGFRR